LRNILYLDGIFASCEELISDSRQHYDRRFDNYRRVRDDHMIPYDHDACRFGGWCRRKKRLKELGIRYD
jgi:hypothetical protein